MQSCCSQHWLNSHACYQAINNSDERWSTVYFPKNLKGVLPPFEPISSKDAQIRNSSNRALSRAEQHLQLSQYKPLISQIFPSTFPVSTLQCPHHGWAQNGAMTNYRIQTGYSLGQNSTCSCLNTSLWLAKYLSAHFLWAPCSVNCTAGRKTGLGQTTG